MMREIYWQEVTEISHWVYFWLISLVLVWFLTFIWMWQFPLCCLLFVIPFILFIRWWSENRVHCSLNHALKWFLHGFINITLLSIFGQFFGLFIIALLFVSTHFIYFPFGHLVFIVLSIAYYVTIEEVLKLYFALKSRDSVQDPLRQITKTHTITATATALGYSMCTGTIWTAFAAQQLHHDDQKYHEKYSLFGWLLAITLIIAVIGMPMQLITGYAIGCKITQKDMEYAANNRNNNSNNNNNNNNNEERPHDRLPFHKYLDVIYHSVFVRSAYLFFLVFGFLILQFSVVGLIIAVLGIICDYILLIKYTKQIESTLPWDYLQRAGQLSIFGYNVLPDHDQADGEQDSDSLDGDDNHQHRRNANNNNDDEVNNPVRITTISVDNFGANHDLDAPMMINKFTLKNEKKDGDGMYTAVALNEKSADDVDVHVRDEILDQDERDENQDEDEDEADDDESSSVR